VRPETGGWRRAELVPVLAGPLLWSPAFPHLLAHTSSLLFSWLAPSQSLFGPQLNSFFFVEGEHLSFHAAFLTVYNFYDFITCSLYVTEGEIRKRRNEITSFWVINIH
jgi:hypothetical protein